MRFTLKTLYASDIEDHIEREVDSGIVSKIKSYGIFDVNKRHVLYSVGELKDNDVIQQNSIVYEVPRDMKVFFIKTQQDEIYCFALNPDEEVKELKSRIANKPGASIQGQTLMFGGKVLVDDKQVREYTIEQYSTVQILERGKATDLKTTPTSTEPKTEVILVCGDDEYGFPFTPGTTTIAQAKQYIKSIYSIEKDFFLGNEKLVDSFILQLEHNYKKFSSVKPNQQPSKGKADESSGNFIRLIAGIIIGGMGMSSIYYACSSTSLGSRLLGEYSPRVCSGAAIVGAILGYVAACSGSGQNR